jgi:hypothetical protein
MYTSTFVSRFPVGFVAVLADPTLRAGEIATSSRRWVQGEARYAFGDFCRITKVTRRRGDTRNMKEKEQRQPRLTGEIN